MRVDTDGFSFDFTDAIDAFVFDETDRTKPTYHGLPMKAVDIVAEFNDAYVFIELKDPHEPEMYNVAFAEDEQDLKKKRQTFKWLKNYLKYKYRDSYLFRHAEHKVDKPIHYICLLTFENGLNVTLQKALKRELPVGKASKRWKQEIVASCQVVNVKKWNDNFPKWPVNYIPA
jgi:hypothetical protein